MDTARHCGNGDFDLVFDVLVGGDGDMLYYICALGRIAGARKWIAGAASSISDATPTRIREMHTSINKKCIVY